MAQHYEAGAPRGRRMQLVDGWQDRGQGLQSGGKVQVGWGTRREAWILEVLGTERWPQEAQELGGGSGD